ncbi:MerR family transcriptional regulator [Cupriavidus gilardii]|uniref:MerR family transcriptional regulator n=1 Tax=Cupriavidus gilardii TaxID=82541 RepID=UPI001574D251|nr:MerR family transcriptional regulator [Cupriavidus gilardii]MCG5259794.1 MerR family transcriptional regulator [Cupriavidus gilardii]MDF9429947.1 MerR family transcriptional regulator [Cupriavidus gilardii]NSX03500.1 MerR family transcriptional regulator [Cupriavidus gilardii]
MSDKSSERITLPPIPAKRYFTIGEVSELCAVKPHVLRYWEQEFTQLKPVKRRGNRRYYQHHEVLLIRRIRELLYEQGFTINGARNRLDEGRHHAEPPMPEEAAPVPAVSAGTSPSASVLTVDVRALRAELIQVQHVLAQLKQIAAKD